MITQSSRRVVLTGMGLVSPLGNTLDSFWNALINGRSGVALMESLPTNAFPSKYAAEARQFTGKIGDFGELEKLQARTIRKGLKVMCREIQMGVAAAQMALANAGVKFGSTDPDRSGVVYGCDYIMTLPDEFAEAVETCIEDDGKFHYDRWADQGLAKITPLWLLKYLPNMPASHIAIYNDFRGPNNSITLREASANLALGEAFNTIARGSADLLITGATGTRVHPMRTVHVAMQEEVAYGDGPPESLSRPFDRDRTGMVLGEGGGAIVLEELEHARTRGATILAELVGYGSSTVMDGQAVAQIDVALRNVMQQALSTAGMTPDQVGHLHAHGLGTRHCDIEESRAIAQVFGARQSPVPVVAAKSHFGHPGASCGVLELIASVLAMQHDQLFPVLNYDTPDPECPISVVTEPTSPGDSVLSVSVSPQGQAGSVLVRRFEP